MKINVIANHNKALFELEVSNGTEHYMICQFPDSVYIRRDDKDGINISEETLFKVLDAFYKESIMAKEMKHKKEKKKPKKDKKKDCS